MRSAGDITSVSLQPTPNLDRRDLEETREALAAFAHEAWGEYVSYMLEKCTPCPDGSLLIPAGYVAALRRLCQTKYDGLTEAEKHGDREQADRMMRITESSRAARIKRIVPFVLNAIDSLEAAGFHEDAAHIRRRLCSVRGMPVGEMERLSNGS